MRWIALGFGEHGLRLFCAGWPNSASLVVSRMRAGHRPGGSAERAGYLDWRRTGAKIGWG
ncbi:hypothetical protein ACFPN7_23370 [Amycolatopsis halotolerans]|uniref:hypothetical protein n=1 Tax=Amycolatopsis halotolerans TaxID=330083 RepID=UPI003616667E